MLIQEEIRLFRKQILLIWAIFLIYCSAITFDLSASYFAYQKNPEYFLNHETNQLIVWSVQNDFGFLNNYTFLYFFQTPFLIFTSLNFILLNIRIMPKTPRRNIIGSRFK